jgi:hypothetical protein
MSMSDVSEPTGWFPFQAVIKRFINGQSGIFKRWFHVWQGLAQSAFPFFGFIPGIAGYKDCFEIEAVLIQDVLRHVAVYKRSSRS